MKSAGFVVVLKNLNSEVFSLGLSFKINTLTPAWKRKNGISSVLILPEQSGANGSPRSLLPPNFWVHNCQDWPPWRQHPRCQEGKEERSSCLYVWLSYYGWAGEIVFQRPLFIWFLNTYYDAFFFPPFLKGKREANFPVFTVTDFSSAVQLSGGKAVLKRVIYL